MCPLRLLFRIVILALVFGAVGLTAAHLVIAHAVAGGARVVEVRMAGVMAGLFAGGTATALTGLGMVMESRRRARIAGQRSTAGDLR